MSVTREAMLEKFDALMEHHNAYEFMGSAHVERIVEEMADAALALARGEPTAPLPGWQSWAEISKMHPDDPNFTIERSNWATCFAEDLLTAVLYWRKMHGSEQAANADLQQECERLRGELAHWKDCHGATANALVVAEQRAEAAEGTLATWDHAMRRKDEEIDRLRERAEAAEAKVGRLEKWLREAQEMGAQLQALQRAEAQWRGLLEKLLGMIEGCTTASFRSFGKPHKVIEEVRAALASPPEEPA